MRVYVLWNSSGVVVQCCAVSTQAMGVKEYLDGECLATRGKTGEIYITSHPTFNRVMCTYTNYRACMILCHSGPYILYRH